MSATTDAIHLIDKLVKAKIPKETATELIEFTEKKAEGRTGELATKDQVKVIYTIMGIGFTALLSIMIYLHSDIKSNMKDLKLDINNRMDRIESKLDRLLKR